jgi:hypothetical protein
LRYRPFGEEGIFRVDAVLETRECQLMRRTAAAHGVVALDDGDREPALAR